MTEQEKEIVAKASVPMSVANVFRWIFLMAALFIVLFLFFGNKLWDQALSTRAYSVLLWDILLMLLSNIVRIIFTARYNRIVKNL